MKKETAELLKEQIPEGGRFVIMLESELFPTERRNNWNMIEPPDSWMIGRCDEETGQFAFIPLVVRGQYMTVSRVGGSE